MKEVTLTPKANGDLEDIWSYSQENFGVINLRLNTQSTPARFARVGSLMIKVSGHGRSIIIRMKANG